MKKLLVILFFICSMFYPTYSAVILPIDTIFEGQCITENGYKKIDEIFSKLNNSPITIEVFCSKSNNYNYSWENANIYAYKISKYLIEKGYEPNKIRYIGYGSFCSEDLRKQNIVRIQKQE